MEKRGIRLSIISVMVILGLSSCGKEFPVMTKEQEAAVGEYAAMLLLKYDANGRSRLVDLSLLEQEEPAPPKQPQTEQEQGGMEPVDDTPVIDNAGPAQEDQAADSMNDILELPEEIVIAYAGQQVCVSYNGGEEDNDYFTVDAAAGKQLLVLNFLMENRTGQEQMVDILSKNVSFRVTVNGDFTRDALPTWLLNDLSTYQKSLASGEQQNVVLVIEVDQDVANSISSITLSLKNDMKTYTIQLV